jgi:hypothetical protein
VSPLSIDIRFAGTAARFQPSLAPAVDGGRCGWARRYIKLTCSSPWSKASGFETRKLAAILAVDILGFSRLTGAEEDRTLASQPRATRAPDRSQ